MWEMSSPSEAAKAAVLLAFFFARHTAFAASLKLDSSYRGLEVPRYFNPLGDRNIRRDAAQV